MRKGRRIKDKAANVKSGVPPPSLSEHQHRAHRLQSPCDRPALLPNPVPALQSLYPPAVVLGNKTEIVLENKTEIPGKRKAAHPQNISNHGALISHPCIHLTRAVHVLRRRSAVITGVVWHVACRD